MDRAAAGGAIPYGGQEIPYALTFRERRTLSITVQPDQTVRVVAPLGTAREQIEARLRKRAGWIVRQQAFFAAFEPLTPARRYVSGESHLYLGRQYRLKLVQAPKPVVKLVRGYLEVYTPDPMDKEQVETQVQDWYRAHAAEKLGGYVREVIKRFGVFDLQPPTLELRRMEKRWGSCTPGGKVILNPDLIRAPKGCIEYVIVHELCHLLEPNHSRAFYDLQERILPDWEQWKERLERVMK